MTGMFRYLATNMQNYIRWDPLLYNQIGPCAPSDWSKTHVLSEYKAKKEHVLMFFITLPLYHKANEDA